MLDPAPAEKILVMGISREARYENEARFYFRPQFVGLEVKLVASELRHEEIANDRVVFVNFHLEEGFLAIERNVDQVIFISQDPLQGLGELFVVVYDQDRFERLWVDGIVR